MESIHLNKRFKQKIMRLFYLLIICVVLVSATVEGQLKIENISDSFTTGYTYGTHCGIAGTPPILRQDIEKMIIQKDISGIERWLGSPSLSHQVYAVEALIRLHHQGVSLRNDLIETILSVKQLQTLIPTCGGCIYDNIPVAEALADYKL